MTGDKPFPRIVVPIDGSLRSESAVFPAAELARRAGVALTLFGITRSKQEREATATDLDDLVDLIGHDLVVDVIIDAVGKVIGVSSYVADSILDEADMDGALVCMASHGRSGLGATILGSVTEDVLRQSSRPVMVVGPNIATHSELADRSVVVCLDGSDFAEQALPAAAVWSASLGMPLWLVQVVSPGGGAAPDLVAAADVYETAYLHSVARRFPGAEFDVLHSNHPAHELADLTTRWPVGVMVIAAHGRSGFSRLTLGSTAMNVVHRATCPVLLLGPGMTVQETDGAAAAGSIAR